MTFARNLWLGTAAAVALNIAPMAASAQTLCRQALAIGLDISGSVDADEYRLQLDGLAGALLDTDVQAAFLAMPDAVVRLFIYEWGGYGTQRALLPWTDVANAQVLNSIAATLQSTTRQPHDPATALGKAMLYGGEALRGQSDCWRLTLDLSGDGKSNIGPLPSEAGRTPDLANVTVNALVISANTGPFSDNGNDEVADLHRYFISQVVRGPDAFVEIAAEFQAFQKAMARKLLKELETRAVGTLAPAGLPNQSIQPDQ